MDVDYSILIIFDQSSALKPMLDTGNSDLSGRLSMFLNENGLDKNKFYIIHVQM